MLPEYSFKNNMVTANHKAFDKFPDLIWLNQYNAEKFDAERNSIIAASENLKWSFKNTKPWINRLSKGCQLCGQGEWSCLFITGRCNANCFYCPAPQDSDDFPTAQTLHFQDAENYADFINDFGFKGVSFSGGEPLLVFEQLVHFLKVIRDKCSPDIYIWMYTNGILATREKFQTLAKLGLNEVRFDIGATGYKLDKIASAAGIIENITVEIPAVPYPPDFYNEIIPQLIDAGVTNLNLHQLRLTQHNVKRIHDKQYTYLHGEHPSVLESELAALNVIKFVSENNFPIGVNYCSFQYKFRFQKAGYRTKISSKVFKDKYITEAGYMLDCYSVVNAELTTDLLLSTPLNELENKGLIQQIKLVDFLQNPNIFDAIVLDFSGATLIEKPELLTKSGSVTKFKEEIFIETGKKDNPIIIQKEMLNELAQLLTTNPESAPDDSNLFRIWQYFYIETGLRNYF